MKFYFVLFLKMFHLSKYISTWNRFSCTKFNRFPAHGLQYCFRIHKNKLTYRVSCYPKGSALQVLLITIAALTCNLPCALHHVLLPTLQSDYYSSAHTYICISFHIDTNDRCLRYAPSLCVFHIFLMFSRQTAI